MSSCPRRKIYIRMTDTARAVAMYVAPWLLSELVYVRLFVALVVVAMLFFAFVHRIQI